MRLVTMRMLTIRGMLVIPGMPEMLWQVNQQQKHTASKPTKTAHNKQTKRTKKNTKQR